MRRGSASRCIVTRICFRAGCMSNRVGCTCSDDVQVPDGAWFPLAVAAISIFVTLAWHLGQTSCISLSTGPPPTSFVPLPLKSTGASSATPQAPLTQVSPCQPPFSTILTPRLECQYRPLSPHLFENAILDSLAGPSPPPASQVGWSLIRHLTDRINSGTSLSTPVLD